MLCREVGTAPTGKYIRIPGSRHCRVQVWCDDECPGFNVTVGLEYVPASKDYDINEWKYPEGISSAYNDNRTINRGGKSECEFARCVRAYNKLFDEGYTGKATRHMPAYSKWSTNSNRYAERLINLCGGSADFPPGALGAD